MRYRVTAANGAEMEIEAESIVLMEQDGSQTVILTRADGNQDSFCDVQTLETKDEDSGNWEGAEISELPKHHVR